MAQKRLNLHCKRQENKGFTLIEIVIYCAIFVMFAITVIESMIWINSKMSTQDTLVGIRNHNVYKIYFGNTYLRNKIENNKIINQFSELLASTSEATPLIKEDRDLGIILNNFFSPAQSIGTTSSAVGKDLQKEKYNIIFFDSINF